MYIFFTKKEGNAMPVKDQSISGEAVIFHGMKCLFLLFLPVFAFAQPKKAVIYSKKTSHALNDKIVVWKDEEVVREKLFIGERTLTIENEQYSIDSTRINTENNRPFFIYMISLRGKTARCYVYPAGNEKEWGLLFDDNLTMILYKLRE
jgi:hypothetical protein